MNYLASPPLVVAHALAGTTDIDLTSEPLGKSKDGKDVFLKDIWPSNAEIQEIIAKAVTSDLFKASYADVLKGDARWQGIKVAKSETYPWDSNSTYIDRKSVVQGKSVSVRVDLGGRRLMKKQINNERKIKE